MHVYRYNPIFGLAALATAMCMGVWIGRRSTVWDLPSSKEEAVKDYADRKFAQSVLLANCQVKSAWMSCPYMTPGDDTKPYHELAEALARVVGEEAKLSPDDQLVVEAAPGYGDQAFLFLREFGVQRIVGIDITESEVLIAQRRAVQLFLDDQVQFVVGDAVQMDNVAVESADKVIVSGAAVHFNTRREFVRRAWKVLKPGGLIVLCDQVARDETAAVEIKQKNMYGPLENVCVLQQYMEMLSEEGFHNVRFRNITDNFAGGPCQGTTLPMSSDVITAFEGSFPWTSTQYQWLPGTGYYWHARHTHYYVFVGQK